MEVCKTSHHGFPVLNSRGNVVGIMPKNYLLTLINGRDFYRMDGQIEEDDDDVVNIQDRPLDTIARDSSVVNY